MMVHYLVCIAWDGGSYHIHGTVLTLFVLFVCLYHPYILLISLENLLLLFMYMYLFVSIFGIVHVHVFQIIRNKKGDQTDNQMSWTSEYKLYYTGLQLRTSLPSLHEHQQSISLAVPVVSRSCLLARSCTVMHAYRKLWLLSAPRC